ncbi:hypothetical protein [Halorhabdus sp. BNX81]|uniref:hypothetical protein n=1 Tax=Halorhabdus sp. BNX81 TaxID=2980181 RepID=UPI0023DCF0C1|nr:hypothetical protein [Halorhabdus sp. BNX81]WEL21955.1 hypothetical protein HBNXHr_1899 [Halorhabdus sp. BNX81]
MATTDTSPDEVVRVQNPEALQGGPAETRLKRHLGRGVYVHDVYELPNGNLEVSLGNASPRDLSDCRDHDNVLKFITLRDVYTIEAKNTGQGVYLIDVPDRGDVIGGIDDREEEIKEKLDFTMAQAIYKHVYDLPAVRTQLNPILQILRAARNRRGLTVSRIEENQRSNNTREYVDLLKNFGYIKVEDHEILPGERLQSADLNEYSWDEFGRKFLGDVVQRGYVTIRDELNLSMLGHYQKYSGAYYFDAVQRGKKDLWLDIDKIVDNFEELHGERKDRFYIQDKLGELASVDVIQKDGDFVKSEEKIYEQVARGTPTA